MHFYFLFQVKLDDGRATVLTYAFISAFKFPDMLNVHLRCTVEICRHGCPEHCTSASSPSAQQGNLVGQFSANEPVGSQSQNTISKVRPGDSGDSSAESGEKNGLGHMPNSIPNAKPRDPLLHNHNTNGPQNLNQGSIHEAPRFPPQPQPHSSGEIFNANVPPQMRPPPPLLPQPHPQFGGRPQRAPRPQPHYQSKFPPGLMRQRPDLMRFPPMTPHGPRFTGTIKHTIGPDAGAEPNFVKEQERHHSQVAQNMLMKPEPKRGLENSAEGGLSERSGEPLSSKEDVQNDAAVADTSSATEEKEKKPENNGDDKEKTPKVREMLMEAQALKGTHKAFLFHFDIFII